MRKRPCCPLLLALSALLLVATGGLPAQAQEMRETRETHETREAGPGAVKPTVGSCVPSPTTLCLLAGQFGVEVDWVNGPDSGQGQVNTLMLDTTGFFDLGDSGAVDVLVRMLDGCSTNGNYWLYVADVSSYGQTVEVTDTSSGNQVLFLVNEGEYAAPVTDLMAFPCTAPAPASAGPPLPELGGGSDSLFLAGRRFRADLSWVDFGGNPGVGHPIALADRAGAFWLFTDPSYEVLVKMVEDPGSGFFTFAFSSVSNVAIDITVTDLCTGSAQTYQQALGAATTFADEEAFPIFCAASIFADDFESGNVSQWLP